MNGFRHAFGNLALRKPDWLYAVLGLQEPDLPVRLGTDVIQPTIDLMQRGGPFTDHFSSSMSYSNVAGMRTVLMFPPEGMTRIVEVVAMHSTDPAQTIGDYRLDIGDKRDTDSSTEIIVPVSIVSTAGNPRTLLLGSGGPGLTHHGHIREAPLVLCHNRAQSVRRRLHFVHPTIPAGVTVQVTTIFRQGPTELLINL